MSSSRDVGAQHERNRKTRDERCPKGKKGQHKWKRHGFAPSWWEECVHCKATVYGK